MILATKLKNFRGYYPRIPNAEGGDASFNAFVLGELPIGIFLTGGSGGAINFFLPGHYRGTTISNGAHLMTQRLR